MRNTSQNPVWKDCPPICDMAQLPSFEEWSEAEVFIKANGSLPIEAKWRCRFCEGWHFWLRPHAPAGESSGNARAYRMPQDILELANAQVSNNEPNQ